MCDDDDDDDEVTLPFVVHHVDDDRRNNSPSNLAKVSMAWHNRHHDRGGGRPKSRRKAVW